MRLYKQNKNANKDNETDIADEELWNRLEELELQEELQNELNSLAEDTQSLDDPSNPQPYILDEKLVTNAGPEKAEDKLESKTKTTVKKRVTFTDIEEDRSSQISSKLDLLQKVLQKQHEIEKQLQELKAKERSQSQNESDLIKKLDETEQLEELEDEMDRSVLEYEYKFSYLKKKSFAHSKSTNLDEIRGK